MLLPPLIGLSSILINSLQLHSAMLVIVMAASKSSLEVIHLCIMWPLKK